MGKITLMDDIRGQRVPSPRSLVTLEQGELCYIFFWVCSMFPTNERKALQQFAAKFPSHREVMLEAGALVTPQSSVTALGTGQTRN